MLKENNIRTKDTLALKTKDKAFLSHLRKSKGNVIHKTQEDTGPVGDGVAGGVPPTAHRPAAAQDD